MKKILFSVALGALTVFNSFGQGVVTFSNVSSDLSSPPDRLVRYDPTASTINSAYVAGAAVFSNGTAGLRAQLYYGASTANESSLVAITAAPTTFKGSQSANVGTWFGGSRTVDGFDKPSTVNLQVRVWDINLASSYEAAVAMGGAYTGLIGTSMIFQYSFPTSPTPAPGEFTMQNFQGFTIGTIPEPSTIVLAGLGAAALLIFRRRK